MSEIIKIIDGLDQKIGDHPFYSVRQLVSSGVFGSMASARRALKQGRLSFVKISPRRFVVPRHEILQFLENNFDRK
jgi:hypothetical protein